MWKRKLAREIKTMRESKRKHVFPILFSSFCIGLNATQENLDDLLIN